MNKAQLKRHLDAIARVDRDVKRGLARLDYPTPRRRPEGFPALLSIIVNQQLSTASANAIWERVSALMPAVTARDWLKLDYDALRSAGMSGRKIEYADGLASAIVDKRFDPAALKRMNDAEAIEQIVAQRGFGRWSAEVYLMFSLRRSNVFPADDLALQVALQKLKGLDERPTPAAARELVDHWQPYLTAGSLFLWHYYRGAPVMK